MDSISPDYPTVQTFAKHTIIESALALALLADASSYFQLLPHAYSQEKRKRNSFRLSGITKI